MTKRERALVTQVEDFADALSAIGRLLTDDTLSAKRRLDQIDGIVKMCGWSVEHTVITQADVNKALTRKG